MPTYPFDDLTVGVPLVQPVNRDVLDAGEEPVLLSSAQWIDVDELAVDAAAIVPKGRRGKLQDVALREVQLEVPPCLGADMVCLIYEQVRDWACQMRLELLRIFDSTAIVATITLLSATSASTSATVLGARESKATVGWEASGGRQSKSLRTPSLMNLSPIHDASAEGGAAVAPDHHQADVGVSTRVSSRRTRFGFLSQPEADTPNCRVESRLCENASGSIELG